MKDILTGRLKELFGIPKKIIPKLHYHLHQLNRQITAGDKINISNELHRITLKLFYTDYFPVVSRNIKIDTNTTSIIMGGIAFNMNIPEKMKYLSIETDDVDIKIFTTDINYLEQKPYAVARVLSIFKFTILIICMYLKQFFNILQHFKIKENNFLNGYELILQIKQKIKETQTYKLVETLDLTKLTYQQLFNKIMDNVSSYTMLITNKIIYKIQNINKNRTITFSDCVVVYANIHSPHFFSQYLNATPEAINKPLEKLIKMKIPISKIMDMQNCENHCRFMSIKSLIMENAVMMSYADLLANENLEEGGQILVPVGYIFKYYKYLVKFIRCYVLKKYNSNTLNKEFYNAAKLLWQYIFTNLKNKSNPVVFGLDERDPIIITYKNYLNEFHQNLFHNKSFLSSHFPVLMEIADEYRELTFFINKSRNLFRLLNESSRTKTTTIENIAIQFAQQELSKYSDSHSSSSSKSIAGGYISKLKNKSIIISFNNIDNYENDSENKESNDIKDNDVADKDITDKDVADKDVEDKEIIKKISKLIKDEIKIYSSFPNTLSKKIKKTYYKTTSKTKKHTKHTKS